MALLEMVNSVRGKLREERVGVIGTQDPLTVEVVDLINDSGSEILEGNDWDFDTRHDGRLWFPAPYSGDAETFTWSLININTISVQLLYNQHDDTGEVFADQASIDAAGFRSSGNRLRSSIIFAGSEKGNTSFVLSSLDVGPTRFSLSPVDKFLIPPVSDSEWMVHCNEQVLPSTVKEVLSVRNEEEPVQLEFVNRDIHFDRAIPRSTDRFGTIPEVVYVGGTLTSTTRTVTSEDTTLTAEAAVSGIGCMVWPIPSADLHLQYTYRVQHADLALALDEWVGVPANIIRLIEWRAFQMALDSGIQNDPQAAARAERQVEKRMLRAQMTQSRQPNLRRVPTSFGMQSRGGTRGRWATQSITAPS
jgi:hypothetical protein